MATERAVVIDNGSGIIKAGLAGDTVPSSIFSNYVARPKSLGSQGSIKDDIWFGTINEGNHKKLSIKYPIEQGVIKNWNDMEKIWKYIYSKDQLAISPEDHPVLITDSVLSPRPNREKCAEIFFESFGVPALLVAMQAVLSLYSTGRVTGIVLDSGDGVTHTVPIYQGFALEHGVRRVDIAGRDVTSYLRLLLKKERINFQTTVEFETVRAIKESLCYLSETPLDAETGEMEQASYTLPDGKCIQVGPSRFRAPEILFRPDLIGEECEGVHTMIKNSIQNVDLDLRSHLYKNILLSGGSTLFKGFGKRLFLEMKNICSKDVHLKICAPAERLYSAWVGGSVLASLGTFQDMWVSKKDYEENGKARVFNKKHSNSMLDQYYMWLGKHNIV